MATYKILVIDDEPGIRSGVARILKNFKADYPFLEEPIDFEIFEAGTGEEGLEIINQQRPDILLLDNKLPGMQGVEVLEYIKKNSIDLIVVMITSYASLELAVKATRDGAFDFIPKPFTPQELRASIENISKHLYLKKMTQKLRIEGKQIRFQFLSVLSHELKSPLNAIEGYLRMIKERQLGQNLDDYDYVITRSFERIKGMRSLVMDMLDLTKLESRKSGHERVRVNLFEVAQNAVDIMRPYAIQKDVDIYIHATKDISLVANRDEMEIVFNNLISNAVKYNSQGGRVDCTIKQVENNIVISVSDTGIGIKHDELERIFDDFYRIKDATTKNISGSGLGLSILKKTIDLYQGTVSVESIEEKGSTFTVMIPVT